jgi:hypothetical protein
MEDEQRFLGMMQLINELKGEVLQLKSSVFVLRIVVAVLMVPTDHEEALKRMAELERDVLAADPHEKYRKENLDVIDAVRQLSKRRSSLPDS